jgi:uncharacterized RDD family membrane protein YckC
MTKPANLGVRSLAAVVDSIVVSVLWYSVIQTWGTTPTSVDSTSLSFAHGKQLTGMPAILLMLATAAYWMVPEWLFSVTLGKLLFDLRVVRLDGKKITLSQSIKRNLLRLIDAFPFYLVGFLTAKLTPLHQRLGDLWAKTLVAKAPDGVRAISETSPTNLPNS